MDGLCRALGSPAGVRLSGQTYRCLPLTLGRLAACETHLLCQVPSPAEAVEIASQGAPQRLHGAYKQMAREAVRRMRADKSLRVAPTSNVIEWLGEPDGVAYTAWLCLRGFRSSRTPETARAYFREHRDDARMFVRVRDCISGIDLAADLDWPPPFLYPPGHAKEGQPVERPRPKYTAWRRAIYGLMNRYHLPKRDIASLTLYELHYLCMDEDDPALGGVATVSKEDERRLRHMTPEQRRRHITQIRED